jgi:maleate isomerase
MVQPRPRPASPPRSLGPVARSRLPDDVAARLVASIVEGKFKLGARLPAERDLARLLHVGRPTLREAIVTLRAVGLLDVRHGEGTFVVDRQQDFLARALGWMVMLDSRAVDEISEAHLALEAAVVDLARQRATSADAAELAARLEQLATSFGQRKRFAAADAAFEHSLGRAGRNQVLARLLEVLRLLAERSGQGAASSRLEQRRAQLAALGSPEAQPAEGDIHIDRTGRARPVALAALRAQPTHRAAPLPVERSPGSPLRIGMITPSSNTMVEPITAALLAPYADQLSVHYARIPVTRIALDRHSQQQFDLDAMLSAARLLADARVHAICWNGISAAWKGSASDRWICEAIQRETGVPATSATLAQLEAFRQYGVRRYALAVPYQDAVRRAIIRVYGEEGFECVSSAHLGISVNFDFAEIPTDTLRGLVRQADSPDAEAMVLTCTNLATGRLVDELEAELFKPVFDSLLLAVWHPLRMLGWDTPLSGWGRVLGDVPAHPAERIDARQP